MKKRIVWVLLLVMLLTGCRKGEAQSAMPDLTETTTPVEVGDPEPEIPNGAVYELVREDCSLRNETGDILVESVYEKVVLQGYAPEITAINEAIQGDCNRFFAESGAKDYLEPEQLENMIRDMGLAYGDLFHNALAEVTHNQNGLLSICISTEWYLGGVFNGDYYGMTFDLKTGGQIQLSQLSDLPEEEFAVQLKQIAGDWLRKTYGENLLWEPEEVLTSYTLSDFLFYIADGELILTFPTYTFTAGAAGPAVIPTGLAVVAIAE